MDNEWEPARKIQNFAIKSRLTVCSNNNNSVFFFLKNNFIAAQKCTVLGVNFFLTS